MAGATALSPASSATSVNLQGMITQKAPLPNGPAVRPGLMPSINRSTGSIANASARYRGLKEIAGGWPSPSPPPETLTANNSWGKAEWGGPAPPSGTHHYVFKLYALKEPVSLKPGANAKALETAIKGKIMAEAKLVGIFSATR